MTKLRFSSLPIVFALIASFLPSTLSSAQSSGPPDVVWAKGVGQIQTVVYSADGSLQAQLSLAVGTCFVRIVRTSDEHVLHTYPVAADAAGGMFAFAPNGLAFAYGDDVTNRIHCVSVADGHDIWSITDSLSLYSEISFSYDSTRLIHFSRTTLGGADPGSIVARDASNGSELFRWSGSNAFSSPTLAEVAVNRTHPGDSTHNWVDFYDTNTGALNDAWAFGGSSPWHSTVGYSGDGSSMIMLAGFSYAALRLSDGAHISSLDAGNMANTSVTMRGRKVYASLYPKFDQSQSSIYVWDIDAGTTALFKSGIGTPATALNHIAVSPDETTVAVAGEAPHPFGILNYYSASDASLIKRADGAGGSVVALAMAPDGLHFATGGPELQIWETSTGVLTARYTFGFQIVSVAWSQDNDTIAVCSASPDSIYTTQLISAADGHVKSVIPVPPTRAEGNYQSRAMAFVANGAGLLTADSDGFFRIWDVASNTLASNSPHWNGPRAVAYSPALEIAALAADSTGIDTVAFPSYAFLGGVASMGSATDLSFSFDGSKLAAGGGGGARVWSVGSPSSFTLIHTYSNWSPDDFYQPVAFDPGLPRYLARSYRDPNTGEAALGIFDTENPDPANDIPLIRYTGEVGVDRFHATRIAYTPNGQYIVYTVDNGNVVVARNPNAPPDNTNHPPVANAGSDRTVGVAHGASTAAFTLDGSASSDLDGDALTYEWSELGSVLATTATVNLSRGPGSYTFDLKVTDTHGAASTDSVIVTVAPPPNAAPVMSVPYSVLGVAGQPITFTAKATDSDGDAVTYSLVDAPSGMTINSATGVVNWTPPQTVSGTFDFHVVATDPYGGSDIKPVTVTVNPAKTAIFKLNQSNLVLTRNGNTVTASFDIDNSSTGTALDVGISVAQLQNKANFVKYPANTPLPGPFTIPGQSSQHMSVSFMGVPAGINATLTITLVYDGGSVNFSRVVVVP